jgi:hypothetical protein
MAQFGGNKNPPWARGGAGQPGGGAGGTIDVPGLVGAAAFGAGQAGPLVYHQGGPGMPPGMGVGPLGVPGGPHGPAVTLAAMAGQPVRAHLSLPSLSIRQHITPRRFRDSHGSKLFTFFKANL